MKFRIINNYRNTKSGIHAEDINQKLEYFHHYWSYLLDSDNRKWLFMKDERFESHRSLFTKINLQFSHNPKRYARRISALFITHPYFESNILVRKNKSITSKIDAVKMYFEANLKKNGKIRDEGSSTYIPQFKSDFKQIEELVVGKSNSVYTSKILSSLISTLQDKSTITLQWKADIKFLINAIIIELYHFGYSLKFIQKLPDYILFPKDSIHDFPF